MAFFFEVLIGGLMAGVMDAVVALGFVLIFKASGVFNFAQGAMVLFAGLFFVGFIELGVPLWISLILTIAVMVLLADRKSVVLGKSVSVRVDIGGRRLIKKKTNTHANRRASYKQHMSVPRSSSVCTIL